MTPEATLQDKSFLPMLYSCTVCHWTTLIQRRMPIPQDRKQANIQQELVLCSKKKHRFDREPNETDRHLDWALGATGNTNQPVYVFLGYKEEDEEEKEEEEEEKEEDHDFLGRKSDEGEEEEGKKEEGKKQLRSGKRPQCIVHKHDCFVDTRTTRSMTPKNAAWVTCKGLTDSAHRGMIQHLNDHSQMNPTLKTEDDICHTATYFYGLGLKDPTRTELKSGRRRRYKWIKEIKDYDTLDMNNTSNWDYYAKDDIPLPATTPPKVKGKAVKKNNRKRKRNTRQLKQQKLPIKSDPNLNQNGDKAET